jgi:CRISPR-associated protein Cas1
MIAKRPAIASAARPALCCAEPTPFPEPELTEDDTAWAKRCELWASRSQKISGRRAMRERPRQPLILSGHGVTLRVENGTLNIRNGYTHYPQQQEIYRFFKGELSIPERIVILDGSGTISFDVLSWLSEQYVSLIRIDWRGEVVCVASRSGYSANPFRVQWQRETRADEFKRKEFAISKITQKIDNSISTLEKSIRRNNAWNKAMEIAYSTLTKLDEKQPRSVVELRALEANAAAAYFRAWKGISIKWRGISKKPIPDSWKEISQRSSLFHLAGNRNASHPINAILNYAYTVLQSELQIDVIAGGYDPTIGIMHEGNNGSAAFIFDLMEPFRPMVDRNVLELIGGHVFDPADFVIRTDGVCRLNPEMARWVAGLVSGPRTGLISN